MMMDDTEEGARQRTLTTVARLLGPMFTANTHGVSRWMPRVFVSENVTEGGRWVLMPDAELIAAITQWVTDNKRLIRTQTGPRSTLVEIQRHENDVPQNDWCAGATHDPARRIDAYLTCLSQFHEMAPRPSDPGPLARICAGCKRAMCHAGETFGWGLCACGSFRHPTATTVPYPYG